MRRIQDEMNTPVNKMGKLNNRVISGNKNFDSKCYNK